MARIDANTREGRTRIGDPPFPGEAGLRTYLIDERGRIWDVNSRILLKWALDDAPERLVTSREVEPYV